jgi:hypothetical protein
MQATLAGAVSAPFHTLTFTPELRTKTKNILNFNYVYFITVTEFQIFPMGLFACFLSL